MDKSDQKLVRSVVLAVNAAARRKWGEGRKVNKVGFTGLRTSHGDCLWTHSPGLKNPNTARIRLNPKRWETARANFWATVSHELAHCHESNHGPGFQMVDLAMQDLLRVELAKRGIADKVEYPAHRVNDAGGYKLPKRRASTPRLQFPDGWRACGGGGWWSLERRGADGYWRAIGVECPTRREAIEDAHMYARQIEADRARAEELGAA